MSDDAARRCAVVDPVWFRRCVLSWAHAGAHRNDEIPGDMVTWGTAEQVRQYERERGLDAGETRRYLSGACWADNCGECTDRVCEHNCGHTDG